MRISDWSSGVCSSDLFKVAQARLGGVRVHHAMRAVGKCQRAIDMMLERAVSRRTQGRPLSDHQFVQGAIADSIIEPEQIRLQIGRASCRARGWTYVSISLAPVSITKKNTKQQY